MRKKILAFLLAVSMLVSLIPMTAFADEGIVQEAVEITQEVAEEKPVEEVKEDAFVEEQEAPLEEVKEELPIEEQEIEEISEEIDEEIQEEIPEEDITIFESFMKTESPEPEWGCEYKKTVKLTTGGPYGMKLGGKDKGEFEFAKINGGWSIKNGEGEYLAIEDGKLSLSEEPFAWTYKNNAFSVSIKTEQKSEGYWWGWIYIPGRGCKTKTTTYYLSTTTEDEKLSTSKVSAELYIKVTGEHEFGCWVDCKDGKHHKRECKYCHTVEYDYHNFGESGEGLTCEVCGAANPAKSSVKISVDVKEKTTKKYIGWWPWGYYKTVTTYTATIKTEAKGVKVTKVQYQMNGGKWTTGTCVTSEKPIESLKVKAWDSNCNIHEYEWPEKPVPVYNITLQTNEHGTASATVDGKTVTAAAADAVVTLTAEPAEGYQLKEWKVVSGGVTVTDNKFTMPESNVTVMAVFEEIPETKTVADILPTEFPNEDFDKLFYDDELPSNPWVKDENFVSCVLDYSTSQDVALINKDDLMDFIGCDLNEKLVKGDNENTWVCTNTYGTFTFVVEDGAFTQITFSDNVGSSDYERFDGTYTAPTAINTVSDVLKTAGKNAPSNTEYWYGAKIDNKNTCGINSDSLEFKGKSGQILIPVSASVTAAGDNYTYSTDDGVITFKMTNKVLKSIAVSNFKDGNAVLNDEYAIKIVEDVIKTAAGDFSKGTESWKYGDYTCNVKVNTRLLGIDCNIGKTTYYVLTLLDDRVTLEGDNWTCIANDEKVKITFNMTEGALTSITVSGCEGDYAVLNGTYAAPIDKASYTMKEKATWFSTLVNGTNPAIEKTSITEIIFSKVAPTGAKVVDGVDLTADGTEKVKGYIIPDGDKYIIHIVGDYIFGNSVCWNMFSGFSNLKTLDFGNFDTSNVTIMFSMFSGCSALKSLDLSSFDTSETSNMQSMFSGCSKLESITFGTGFKTSKVTSMTSMFNGCSALKSLDLSSFVTSEVTQMGSMFKDCSTLESLDLSKFNTKIVTDMPSMFNGCSGLTSLNLSSFDTSAVKDMNGMFTDCSSLESITFGTNFDTSKVTAMNAMFSGCSALESLDLSRFDTSAVINMDAMFKNCSTLESLDLSKFDTSAVTKMSNMFNGCSTLERLDISNFTVGNGTTVDDMFSDCSKLTSVKISPENEKIAWALGNGWTYNEVNGAYEKTPPAPATKTVAEVLATVDDFPTSNGNAWKNGMNSCYNSGDNLHLEAIVKATFDLPLTTAVSGSGDSFTCSYESVTFTFNMTEGKLTSIGVVGTPSGSLDGTYAPAAPAPTTYIVTFNSDGPGEVQDSNGQKVTDITVPSGTTFTTNDSIITIGGTPYTAVVTEGGYEFHSFSPPSGTIIADTNIEVMFAQDQPQ